MADGDFETAGSFVEIVRRVFRFLEAEYSFKLVEASKEVVRFESGSVAVWVYWESISLEVGVRVATRKESKRGFNLGHMMALTDEDLGWSYRDPDTRPPSNLETALEQVACALVRYGRPSLEGDAEFFERLRNMSDRFVERSAAEHRQRRTQRAAQKHDST